MIENKLEIGAKWLHEALRLVEYVISAEWDRAHTSEETIVEIAAALQQAYNEGRDDGLDDGS